MGGGASRNPKFLEFLQSLQTILLKEYSAGNTLVYMLDISTLCFLMHCIYLSILIGAMKKTMGR